MECKPTKNRMLKYACPNSELSCIIGNLFIELAPPCQYCNADNAENIVICGTTYAGEEASLIITKDGFFFNGNPDTMAAIRQRRCIKVGK